MGFLGLTYSDPDTIIIRNNAPLLVVKSVMIPTWRACWALNVDLSILVESSEEIQGNLICHLTL